MHDDLLLLDAVRLNFSQASLHVMNISIGFIMFGVALGIRWENFKRIFLQPKSVIVGIVSQFAVLPAVTFLGVWIFSDVLTPSVAFGLILVASCPGGNISNFVSSVAKANVELSVSLTALGTVLAVVFTPLNFAFWGGLYAATSPLLRPIQINPFEMFQTVVILLGLPVAAGILFSQKLPKITRLIEKPIQKLSIVIFALFVVMAFRNNYTYFIRYINWILLIVLIHNSLAFMSGYWFSRVFGLNRRDSRTISIETGIQNSGLGLVLLFNPKIFPHELHMGGMAFIAAWWGIWHIISGLSLASFWTRKRPIDQTVDC